MMGSSQEFTQASSSSPMILDSSIPLLPAARYSFRNADRITRAASRVAFSNSTAAGPVDRYLERGLTGLPSLRYRISRVASVRVRILSPSKRASYIRHLAASERQFCGSLG